MTREKFEAYQKVRESGKTNMLDFRTVSRLSGGALTPDDVWDIIEHYDDYLIIWPREEGSHG